MRAYLTIGISAGRLFPLGGSANSLALHCCRFPPPAPPQGEGRIIVLVDYLRSRHPSFGSLMFLGAAHILRGRWRRRSRVSGRGVVSLPLCLPFCRRRSFC